MDTHGNDLGIDTVAAGKRDASVLKFRAAAATEKSKRHKFLVNTMASSGVGVKYVRKAQATARQSMNLSHVYGDSAIGASPAIHNKQKSNLSVATGIMDKGSSRTFGH